MSDERLAAADPAAGLARAAHAAGISLEGVYVVGGAVRDALLGLPSSELDLVVVPSTTYAAARDLAPRLADALGGRVEAAHSFGTATVVVPWSAVEPGRTGTLELDVATARIESYSHPGALPDVTPVDDIVADMARRDFTMNAMALPLAGDGVLVDPHGGRVDLERGLVRVLHEHSFVDDPTRILRASRMAARFGQLEPRTRELIAEAVSAGAIATVSSQRITTELRILLGAPQPEEPLVLLWEWGVLGALELDPGSRIGELVELLRGPCDPVAPHGTIMLARMAMVLYAAGRETIPACIELPVGHAADVEAAARLARALRDGGDDALAAVRAMRDCDPAAIVLLGAIGAASARDLLQVRAAVRLRVGGRQLLDLGMEPGPAMGEVLNELAERKLRGELVTLRDEIEAARKLMAARAGGASGGS